MTKKIFTEQGFLNTDGRCFVDDSFTKDVGKILATATNYNDVSIICGILKSIIDEYGSTIKQGMLSTKIVETSTTDNSFNKTLVQLNCSKPL